MKRSRDSEGVVSGCARGRLGGVCTLTVGGEGGIDGGDWLWTEGMSGGGRGGRGVFVVARSSERHGCNVFSLECVCR